MTLFATEAIDAPVPLTDRGLAYGHGVFETVAVSSRGPVLLEQHLARLWQGIERLGLVIERSRVVEVVQGAIAAASRVGSGSGVLKVWVSAGDSARGYAAPASGGAARIRCQFDPAVPNVPRSVAGLRLKICQIRLPLHPPLAGIKHLNRLDQVLAAAELSGTEWDDGVLLDAEGCVVEAVSSNLFMLRSDDTAVTPPVDRCGVAGTLRAFLLEQLPLRLDVPVVEERLQPAQLAGASAVFLASSVRGVRAVTEIEGLAQWQHSATIARIAHWLREEVLFEFQHVDA